MLKRLTCFLIPLIVCVTSCGYKIGQGPPFDQYTTFNLSIIGGEENYKEIFSSAIAYEVARLTKWNYHPSRGEVSLIVKLIDLPMRHIGFRHEEGSLGEQKIVPTETRLVIVADVTLLETTTRSSIFPVVRIEASIDFDHDYYSIHNAVNVFSLGQLNDFDTALDSAYVPLAKVFSEKVVAYLLSQ